MIDALQHGLARTWRRLDNFWCGVCNIIRWAPVIWRDADFDWEYLAKVMEYKLRRMERRFTTAQIQQGWKEDARQCRLCADLLHRLREDEYWENAKRRFGSSEYAAKHATEHSRADKRYLGVILGKYLNHWWD